MSGPELVEKAMQACLDAGDSKASIVPIREYLRLVVDVILQPYSRWRKALFCTTMLAIHGPTVILPVSYKQVRELKLRQSERVVSFGNQLLRGYRSSIPKDEYWTCMEQVAEAAMDVKALDLAFSIVNEIRLQFPETQRALRLTAMYFEAKGKYEEAEKVITKMLEQRPDSEFAVKRQVALEKTKGNLGKAIELLRNYVDQFMTDREAWEELASLYLQAQLYAQSAFCYEEVILHQPQNAPVYVQYADVLYTLGGSYIKTARQYYAAALKLSNGENMRALYGITCTAAALATKGKISQEDEELNKSVAKLLQKKYSEENEKHKPLLVDLLKAQGLA